MILHGSIFLSGILLGIVVENCAELRAVKNCLVLTTYGFYARRAYYLEMEEGLLPLG